LQIAEQTGDIAMHISLAASDIYWTTTETL